MELPWDKSWQQEAVFGAGKKRWQGWRGWCSKVRLEIVVLLIHWLLKHLLIPLKFGRTHGISDHTKYKIWRKWYQLVSMVRGASNIVTIWPIFGYCLSINLCSRKGGQRNMTSTQLFWWPRFSWYTLTGIGGHHCPLGVPRRMRHWVPRW